MSVSEVGQLGVTKLRTRREARFRAAAAVLFLVGVLGAAWIGSGVLTLITDHQWRWPSVELRPMLAGAADGGPLIDATGKSAGVQVGHLQFPLLVDWPTRPGWSLVAGIPVLALWYRLVVARVLRGSAADPRHRGLAGKASIRSVYGVRVLRRSGRFTLPTHSWWARLLLPATAFGYSVGRPTNPTGRAQVWVNWEQRVRIIARSGWGKTLRLLIPIIRQLPGPAVISSIEPEIFLATVTARQFRRLPARFRVMRLHPRWRTIREYPIVVLDFSSPETRFAAGYPTARWNPIPGCQDYTVATRRADALVNAVDTEPGGTGHTDQFFRASATQVLAAWLHAAAFAAHIEIDDLVEWLRDGDTNTPRSILERHRRVAEPSAVMTMLKHLDPKAGRTTSGVERYLSFALSSIGSGDGRAMCGNRADPQLDMPGLIAAGGTLYLLAEPERMDLARPLLSLFATEMFLAAEHVARSLPGKKKRLPQTFIGVLDELRYGVRVSNLPYVANVLRKFGISYIYACQSSGQEQALFGPDGAEELRAAAATSIYGGIDPTAAKDITDRAGATGVVTASRGTGGHHSEQVQLQDTLTIGDQQRLADGESVILGRGIAPFLTYTRAVYETRRLRRQVDTETTRVNGKISRRRAAQHAADTADQITTHAGYTPERSHHDQQHVDRGTGPA